MRRADFLFHHKFWEQERSDSVLEWDSASLGVGGSWKSERKKKWQSIVPVRFGRTTPMITTHPCICMFFVLNPFLPQVSSLMLYVEEAHKLPVKYFTNPYCNIYLNSVQVAKTHPREGQNPVFTEEFIFEWVCHTSGCIFSFIYCCFPLSVWFFSHTLSLLGYRITKCIYLLFQWLVKWNQQIWNQPEQQNKKEQRKRHL